MATNLIKIKHHVRGSARPLITKVFKDDEGLQFPGGSPRWRISYQDKVFFCETDREANALVKELH